MPMEWARAIAAHLNPSRLFFEINSPRRTRPILTTKNGNHINVLSFNNQNNQNANQPVNSQQGG